MKKAATMPYQPLEIAKYAAASVMATYAHPRAFGNRNQGGGDPYHFHRAAQKALRCRLGITDVINVVGRIRSVG